MNGETLQQKTTHKERKNSQLQDLQRKEGGAECIWNTREQIHCTIGHHGAKANPPGTRRHFDINDWSKLGPDVILIA